MIDGVTISGAKELKRMLDQLPDKLVRKVLRQSVNKSLTPVLKQARKSVPVDSGGLKKSLMKKVKTYTKTSTIYGMVGPRAKAAPHAHLVEEGTAQRRQKKSGRRTGRMPAYHILQKALDENKTKLNETMREGIKTGVEREAMKLGKK